MGPGQVVHGKKRISHVVGVRKLAELRAITLLYEAHELAASEEAESAV